MYEDFWGLQASPFNLTADSRFFYLTPASLQALSTIRSAIYAHKGLILLTGEPGTGKTMLLHLLRQSFTASAEHVDCIILPLPSIPFSELLMYLCQQLDLTEISSDPFVNLQAIFRQLLLWEIRGRTAVLFIDEAHHLEKKTLDRLQLLLNLDGPHGKLLQIVLAGQPELQAKLAQPELRHIQQRVAIHSELHPLRDHEVEAFICHRLHAAGGERLDLFSPEAIARIYMYSCCIPRLISVICDNALLAAYWAGEQTVSAACVEEVARNLMLITVTKQVVPTQVVPTIEIGQEVQQRRSNSRYPFFVVPQRWMRRALVTSLALLAVGLFLGTQNFPALFRHLQVANLETPPIHSYSPTVVLPRQSPTSEVTAVVETSTLPRTEVKAELPHPAPQEPETFVQEKKTNTPQTPRVPRPEEASSGATLKPSVTPELMKKPNQPLLAEERPARVVVATFFSPQAWVTKPVKKPNQPLLAEERPARVVVATFFSPQAWITKPVLPPKYSFKPTPSAAARAELKQRGVAIAESELLNAAENGDFPTVNLLLSAGISPNAADAQGWTGLMLAARDGRLDILQTFLNCGALVDARNNAGTSALIIAALNDHPGIVTSLLNRGADINAKNHQGWTALMYASWKGHRSMVATLLERGANVALKDNEGKTALMYARWRDDTQDKPSSAFNSQVTLASNEDYRAIADLLRRATPR